MKRSCSMRQPPVAPIQDGVVSFGLLCRPPQVLGPFQPSPARTAVGGRIPVKGSDEVDQKFCLASSSPVIGISGASSFLPEAETAAGAESDREAGPRSVALARYALAQGEGTRLDEFEIRAGLALGKERNATANQHRVDPRPISSIKPNPAPSAASVAPPIAMSPSPDSARNCSMSSARPRKASRALPCTVDGMEENTTFGSGFHSAAHSSSERKTSSSGAVQAKSPSGPTM
jgi:hypothetical protein